MKLTDFYIHYRLAKGGVWCGLNKFRTRTPEEAMQIAKEIFIENWNFANYPSPPDGEERAKLYEFAFYRP
jgi:hypothetical protein